MKCYQMFLFVLWAQAGSDCLYIFCRASSTMKTSFLEKYCANFLFLDNICCYLQNALTVSFKLNRRAKLWVLEELRSPPIQVTADIAVLSPWLLRLMETRQNTAWMICGDIEWWLQSLDPCFVLAYWNLCCWIEVRFWFWLITSLYARCQSTCLCLQQLLTEVSYSDNGVLQHFTSELSELKEKYFRNPFRREDIHKAVSVFGKKGHRALSILPCSCSWTSYWNGAHSVYLCAGLQTKPENGWKNSRDRIYLN